jgi:hypothetical protein
MNNLEAALLEAIHTGDWSAYFGLKENGFGSSAAIAQANAVAAVAGNPAPSIPLVPGAVEILRFSAGLFFSGAAGAASTVYMTPGEGL